MDILLNRLAVPGVSHRAGAEQAGISSLARAWRDMCWGICVTGQVHRKTTIVYEYPTGEGDPYYPIPRKENQEIYNQYKKLADEMPDVYFTGRLGTYKYYNMDQVVAQSLALFRKILKESEHEIQIQSV